MSVRYLYLDWIYKGKQRQEFENSSGLKKSKQRSDISDVYTGPNDPLKFFLNHIQILLFQAFQLTSHKQLEQNNTAENIIEEIMEESDESPPYLPAPSAPSPSQDFVEKSV